MEKNNSALTVEYLVFIDNESIKCTDPKSFNNLLQSDPDISISKSLLAYKNLSVHYKIQSGKVSNLENHYFHLMFTCDLQENIDAFTELLRAVKSVLHVTNKTPQTLYDGVSLYYSHLAYPLIFEVESLMRKLITKFMLTNVGADWIKERVPDDVKSSINIQNRDITYLHNVDFIQLKNFLFSENYPSHKDYLIRKLKDAKSIDELKIEDIKLLVPVSNWERYFSQKVDVNKELLSKQWSELYDLRCKIAHNRAFSKGDLEDVKKLYVTLKSVITSAIDNLDKIDITESEGVVLSEAIAANLNYRVGEFLANWTDLTKKIYLLAYSKNNIENAELGKKYGINDTVRRTILKDLKILLANGLITNDIYEEICVIYKFRNAIVHNQEPPTDDIIRFYAEKTKAVIDILPKVVNYLESFVILRNGNNEPKNVYIGWSYQPYAKLIIDGNNYPNAYKIIIHVGCTFSNIKIKECLFLYQNNEMQFVYNIPDKDSLNQDDWDVLELIKQATLQNLAKK